MTQATNTALGEIKLAGDLAGNNDALAPELTSTGVTPGQYVFPHITIDAKGRITAAENGTSADFPIPNATTTEKGIVRIGSGLAVSGGLLTLDAPDATTVSKGIVSIGNGLAVAAGVVSLNAPDASAGTKGIVQVGSGIDVNAGVISATEGSAAVKGVLQVGSGLSVVGGEVSVALAEGAATFGAVKSNNTDNITISSGLIDVGTNVVKKDTANTYTKSQATALYTLTYGVTVTPDFSQSNVFVLTATGNFTLAAPTNVVNGGVYQIIVKQDATGNRVITWDSVYKFRGAGPALSTLGDSVDIISMVAQSGTFIITELQKGYA